MIERTEGNVHANGIDIHYYRYQSGDKSKKPAILLLHGVTDSGACWPVVAHDLAHDYDVIATDARGHGLSGGPDANGFNYDLLADDAAAVIRALGLEKAFVFGHSMGAMTAALLAGKYPDLVRAVVLEDPPWIDRPFSSENRKPGEHPWQWVFDMQKLSREERIAIGRVQNSGWAEEEITPWADSKAEFRTAIFKNNNATLLIPWRPVASGIPCPVLLLIGDTEYQAIVPLQIAEEARQSWQPSSEVAQIKGAGHCIHRDRYDETMAHVRAFLKKQ